MSVELSDPTRRRLEKLFSGPDQRAVTALLLEECGSNLPGCEGASPEALERVRFAVLKLSHGDTARLIDAILLAQVDWRDLLVAAEFANDVHAHMKWWPE